MLTRALDEGDDTALTQAVGERVAPHAGGGAYATALVDALGARALVRVAAHLPAGGGGVTGRAGSGGSGTGSTDPGVPLACTWTSLLATATSSPLWDEGHREALARDLVSLVTVTGDLTEPDTLLLPLGFRRLLTADQDPLTAAAAGTQAPGAGGGQSGPGQVPGTTSPDQVPGAGSTASPGADDGRGLGAGRGRSGSRDPLVLEPKFLASLVRGVMAGETGATTGGLRVGWVEYARLTTTAGGGYSNFPEDAPREVRARYLLYDPLAAVLTAAARTPATVLDVLAPPVSGPDPRTLGPSRRDTVRRVLATRVDGSLWAWVAARAQKAGPACLEALAAAVASASTLRYRPTAPRTNLYEEQAAWLTEQAVVTLAGVDATAWTPPARRAAAVVLANSVGDLWDVATGGVYARGYQPFYRSLPVAWSGRHDVEVTVLLREVLTDDTALAVLSRAVGVLSARHLLSAALTARAPGSWAQAEDTPWKAAHAWLLVVAGRGATLEGYLYAACATGRGVGEDEESPAAGVALAALVQGLDLHGLDPHAPWRPPAAPARAARAVTGGPSLTSQDLGDSVAYDLYHTLLLVMDRTRLLPDEAYLEPPDPFEDETDDQPPRPWNADWMYQDDQDHWHLDPDRADNDPDGFRTWTTTHPVMAATTSGRYSIGTRYDQGVSTQGRPPARHGPGIPPGQAALALLLTAATARLVYGYSHTYQRRAQRHWQHRRARQRRRQERHRHQH
ncbi:hypothetical protein [Actinomyces sp. HMT897]|uniref:hypothetical protein n=1 Tax=Actinomyces sp. HMT897 TaxID=2789424 RepID=UPI00190C116F|nr:hypothetical protein [Actinomyces sp. HMT897]QQO77619.1 hypothetical protein JJJ15_11540 [Actinomyces sp. HMT897]